LKQKFHSFSIGLYYFLGIFTFVYLTFYGWDYYTTPISERVFHDKHFLLKPSGLIGHGIGILGSLMMIIGVSSYMLRKRWRKLHRLGFLKHWLEFHIFMCSVGPMLVLFHSAFKFGGIISVGLWSMIIVVLSGVIGRVIYIQLPKTLQGENLSKDEIEKQVEELFSKLDPAYQERLKNIILDFEKRSNSNQASKSYEKSPSFFESIKSIFEENSKRKKELKLIKSFLKSQTNISRELTNEYFKISSKIISLRTKELLYSSFDSLFRHWHIFHIPFAVTMFFLMFVHIIVAILFGAKWIF
jgi:hypothetical protein